MPTSDEEHREIGRTIQERMENDTGERIPLEVVLADNDLLEESDLEGYQETETSQRDREQGRCEPNTLYVFDGKVFSGRKLNELADKGHRVGFPARKLMRNDQADLR